MVETYRNDRLVRRLCSELFSWQCRMLGSCKCMRICFDANPAGFHPHPNPFPEGEGTGLLWDIFLAVPDAGEITGGRKAGASGFPLPRE